jgi:hypothetical protein
VSGRDNILTAESKFFLGQSLFVVDNNDRPLSKPIDHSHSSSNSSELHLATFLYDDKINEKILLTPEQYLISVQQAEFTSRKFLAYVMNKDQIPISLPIHISDTGIQMRHLIENIISNKLNLLNSKRQVLFDQLESSGHINELLKCITSEYELIDAYLQDRLDKLKTEEKIIEQIVPILGKLDEFIY